MLAAGEVVQRVANRTPALLALDGGECQVKIGYRLGKRRAGRWDL
jgi:hypothetical protein